MYPAGVSKAARLAIISGSSSGVRHKPDGFPDQSTVRAARKLEPAVSLPANSPPNLPGAHRRAQSRSDSEREKVRYHFYHFKGQLPLETARNCDSLRVSANAVLFYNSGCRHPLRHASRSRVSGLRNRRGAPCTFIRSNRCIARVVNLVHNAMLVMCLFCWGYTFVVPRWDADDKACTLFPMEAARWSLWRTTEATGSGDRECGSMQFCKLEFETSPPVNSPH